ncbi:MAG: leucyl/phenylalanyl-tRNA--protein transferase [Spirochaetaceae bacterium]|jgi:leucyl/phenylalanyl-tRNA--protein transferase|nr:leucyl/phenylalanyl-tRNA--protein transferase [Spirochaetaceae bacterium]
MRFGPPSFRPGPDPRFPRLSEHERFAFPRPEEAGGDIVAVGGNLSPGMLLSAYEQGIFPWYNPEDPLIWQSPDPRFVIFPQKLHVSSSMEKILRRGDFEIAFDRDFPAVIKNCAEICRKGQKGTWITGDIIDAYTELHRLGWAHSAESYAGGELAGGCYGIRLGNVFCGESMFARRSNASKAAFLTLARLLFADGLAFIDCQMPTPHLAGLGGEEVGRREFLSLLGTSLAETRSAGNPDMADRRGNWAERYGR